MSVALPTMYSGYITGEWLSLKDVGRNCGELTWCSILILASKDQGKPQKPQWRVPFMAHNLKSGPATWKSRNATYLSVTIDFIITLWIF